MKSPPAKFQKQKAHPPYDMIGSIAVLEIPKGLGGEKKIAAAILKNHPNIKTVAKKAGATGGKYRIRKIKFIAGEKTSKTICRESGCNFLVDLNKAYYTPRFGSERLRIAKLVEKGENILVPFAGIGPYPIVIEKNAINKPAKIIAIELNPNAFSMMTQNIAKNKCQKIIAIKGDAKKAMARKSVAGWAGRIIMPHPTQALKFLPSALRCAKRGAIIHLYAFDEVGAGGRNILSEARKIAKKKNAKLTLASWRVARPFSAKIEQIVLDLKVQNKA